MPDSDTGDGVDAVMVVPKLIPSTSPADNRRVTAEDDDPTVEDVSPTGADDLGCIEAELDLDEKPLETGPAPGKLDAARTEDDTEELPDCTTPAFWGL